MNIEAYHQIVNELKAYKAQLVAVSKTKPIADIQTLLEVGQLVFGENKVQEMTTKHEALDLSIQWHMIGHLQRNKVKYMAPYVSLIHGIDSLRLLQEVDKQGAKAGRKIHCLLQMHIAEEESKFGLSREELDEVLKYLEEEKPEYLHIQGLMGMATNTKNEQQVTKEFKGLKQLFDVLESTAFSDMDFNVLSMGMSGDYKLALEAGSNMVRVGSMIFGARNYWQPFCQIVFLSAEHQRQKWPHFPIRHRGTTLVILIWNFQIFYYEQKRKPAGTYRKHISYH